MQIKATVRHHYVPNLLLKNTIPHPDEVEELELILCWRECKMVQPRWKIAAQFLKHILNTPSYLPKDKVRMKSSTWMFIVALFVITQSWQQPTCPSIGKWINDYSYNEYCSATKSNSLSVYTADTPQNAYVEWKTKNVCFHLYRILENVAYRNL